MNITLRPVTIENFEDITDLQLREDQREYVASNSYSIAQASFYKNYHTRAIYADESLAGFFMFVTVEENDQSGEYAIWRFMVDQRYQGKGIGRAALRLLLDQIKSMPDVRKIWISYVLANPVAKDFYASAGFVETGIDEEGEMNAVIDLT